MANKMRGGIAFPEAGEGVYLRFLTDDIAKLRNKLGNPDKWFPAVFEALNDIRPDFLEFALLVGAKQEPNGEPCKIEIDQLQEEHDLSLQEIGIRAIDAVYLAVTGQLYSEVIAEAAKQLAGQDDPSRDRPTGTGSIDSESKRSGRASRRQNSGAPLPTK